MNREKQLLGDPQEGSRDITWQIWLPGLKEPIGMVFGDLSQGWSLKRATPGEGLLLGTLRVEFEMGGVRP